MKTLFTLLAALLFYSAATAQQTDSTKVALPQHAYCEIITRNLPGYRRDGVLFDFGQATGAWEYNWLKDAQGNKYAFNSGVEALNFMTRQGWEFVQAYPSGETSENTHYLLRIATSRLTEEQQAALLAPPALKSDAKKK